MSMTDLKTRFRTLELVPVPDLRDEVKRRTEAGLVTSTPHVWTRYGGRHTARQTGTRRRMSIGMAMALVGLILIGTLGAFLGAGALLNPASPTPGMPATPQPSPVPSHIASPTAGLVTNESGKGDTVLGPINWTILRGDDNSLPMGPITATANGFAAIDQGSDGSGARLWRSADGIEWTVSAIPIPAEGEIRHVVSGNMHWIWSSDLHLWQSADLGTWTEVDLSDFHSPAIEGFRVSHEFATPYTDVFRVATAGDTALLQFESRASFDSAFLTEGLGLTPPGFLYVIGRGPGEETDLIQVWSLAGGRDHQVGQLRVEVTGSAVTVSDADRGNVVVTINAADLGMDAADLATQLLDEGEIMLGQHAIAITDGRARPVQYLDHLVMHAPVSDGFIAVTNDDESYEVWSSPDGERWDSIGTPSFPTSEGVRILWDTPVDDLFPEPGIRLAVWLEGPGAAQHVEIWATEDGLAWAQAAVLPGDTTNLLDTPYRVPGGYMAFGSNDSRVYFSPGGTLWSAMDGRPETDRLVEELNGWRAVTATKNVAFIVDSSLNGRRKLVRLDFLDVNDLFEQRP
jgi:hypothetical protein